MRPLVALLIALFPISANSQHAKPIFVSTQQEEPILVLNGIVVKPGYEIIDKLSVDQIESLTTYSSVEAVSKFGEFLGSNGVVSIKTKFDGRRVDLPKEAILTYGDKKPVVVLNGKIIDYDKLDQLTGESPVRIHIERNIDLIDRYGLQSINGVMTITSF